MGVERKERMVRRGWRWWKYSAAEGGDEEERVAMVEGFQR
jgi:hypothetical protein